MVIYGQWNDKFYVSLIKFEYQWCDGYLESSMWVLALFGSNQIL